MRRTAVALLVGLGVLATACTGDDDTTSPDNPSTTISGTPGDGTTIAINSLRFASRLEPFGDCDSLLARIREEAAARVGPYGLPGFGYYGGPGVLVEDTVGGRVPAASSEDAAVGAPAETDDGSTPSTDFSGTNVAESGVDEADLVKTDGRILVTVQNGRLHVIDLSGDEPREAAALALDQNLYTGELLLDGDRVYVISQGGGFAIPLASVGVDRIAPTYGSATTTITEIDLADLANPHTVRSLTVDGTYSSVRVVDGIARVVVSSLPTELPFLYPANPAGEDRAEEVNRQVIAESTVEQWLPAFTLETPDGDPSGGLLLPCDAVDAPTEFAGFGVTSVLTIDLTSGLADNETEDSVGILAPGGTVYASPQSLYVATNSFVPDEAWQEQGVDQRDIDERYGTSIHQFSIEGSGPAEYRASGTVPGHLLNDLSLSELDGDLRVATTLGSPWSTDSSESVISVLRRDGEDLATIGSVGGLGEGEQIYAARFIGTQAYVVTFRQTDPFYVVDLSDPTNPVVKGQLKIPGYSGYLHSVGDGLVLGIGQNGNDDGNLLGLKATLFDVSDPGSPTELGTWIYGGDRYSSSGIEYDRKAFLWWAEDSLAAVPVNDYDSGFNGVVLLRVTPEGITEFGRIDQTNDQLGQPTCEVVPDQELASPNYYPNPGQIVQACGNGEDGGIDGYDCYQVPASDLESYGLPATVAPQDGFLEVCTPPYNSSSPIQRTVVVGENLWTVSYQWIQANAKDTLEQVAKFSL